MNSKTQENLKKSFAMSENLIEKYWDMLQVSLGSLSWSQDQLESMTKKYMEQSKLAREENNKLMEELMKQIKNNQVQLHNMVKQAINTTMETVDVPGYNYFEELSKKVEALSKKVDEQE